MSGLLLAEGTNFQPRLFTQHLLRAGATKARVTNGMEQIETSGTMTQEVYYRLIPVLGAKPGAWTATGITRTTPGSGTNDVTFAGGTEENLMVQFALFAKNTGGSPRRSPGWRCTSTVTR